MTEKPALPALASQFAVPKTSQHIVQSDGMSITLQCKLSYSARIPVYGSNPTSNVSEALFYIEKPILSMHEKRSLYDANGTLLFDIKERQSTFTTQCCIYVGGEETRVGNVGKSCNGYLLGQFGYGEKSFQDLLAVEKGSWWRGSVNLRHIKTDEIVARANFRPPSMEYTLDIAPGADMALIIAFCVAMDYKAKEDKTLEYLWKGVKVTSTIAGLGGVVGN